MDGPITFEVTNTTPQTSNHIPHDKIFLIGLYLPVSQWTILLVLGLNFILLDRSKDIYCDSN